MKVKDLINFLKTQDQNLRVAYAIHSEHSLLNVEDIKVKEMQPARQDGWIHDEWTTKFNKDPILPKEKYLVFPGN